MILQPVFSIFPCSPLPSGTCRTPGLSIPWCCLPTSSSVCLVFFPLSLCLARWFWPDLMNGRHDHSTAVCVSLQSSGGLDVVQLPAGSWHGLPHWWHGLCSLGVLFFSLIALRQAARLHWLMCLNVLPHSRHFVMCVQVILSVMDTSTTVQFMLPRIVHCWCHHQSPVLMLCRPVVSTVSTTETPYMPSGPSLEMMVWWRCRAAWFLHCITSSSWTESAWECIRWASLMCTGWISLSFYLGFNWYVIESGQGFILMMYDGVTKLHILFFFFSALFLVCACILFALSSAQCSLLHLIYSV